MKVIKEVYAQQKEMFDNHKHSLANRIVNLNQPHVRPIVRGKASAKTEFGAKVEISVVDGYVRVEKLSWDAYNECDRNAVEGKFGEGKRAYGLSRIFAKLKETSECVINAVFLVLNLNKRLKSLLQLFLEKLLNLSEIKKYKFLIEIRVC